MLKISLFFKSKLSKLHEEITQEFLGLRMRNFQGIAKYKILQFHSNGHSFFTVHYEIWNCIIRSLNIKYKIFKVIP